MTADNAAVPDPAADAVTRSRDDPPDTTYKCPECRGTNGGHYFGCVHFNDRPGFVTALEAGNERLQAKAKHYHDIWQEELAKRTETEQRLAAADDALRQLVTLKDMKDGFGKPPFGEHNSTAAIIEYARLKPIAWDAARATLDLAAAPKEAAPDEKADAARYRAIRKMLHWFKNFDSPEEVDRTIDAALGADKGRK